MNETEQQKHADWEHTNEGGGDLPETWEATFKLGWDMGCNYGVDIIRCCNTCQFGPMPGGDHGACEERTLYSTIQHVMTCGTCPSSEADANILQSQFIQDCRKAWLAYQLRIVDLP